MIVNLRTIYFCEMTVFHQGLNFVEISACKRM
ncbi:hypothetical protein EDF75_0631 [Raoultella sp. BIGb0149]|nr:hypothetical protein EDF75_0631 [Raoultella sp. BIGb0149]